MSNTDQAGAAPAANHPSTRPYIVIWGVLLAALAISLVIGGGHPSGAIVAVIFAIAIVKAALVLAFFMHLRGAPLHFKLVLAGALAAIAILYVGLVPDIVWVFGRQ